MGFSVYYYFQEPEKITILGTKSVISGFGEINLYDPETTNLFSANTYQDTIIGFQVSIPNVDWSIHSTLNEMSSDELESLKTKGFLDGVYVGKNHDKRFIITVFDMQVDDFSLDQYVNSQISLIQSQTDAQIPIKQISSENDWTIFAVDSFDQDNSYGEQLLFFKDNRLYMLQYYGSSPQALNSEQKNEFKLIIDSFEVI
jgi:hypothetical protein